MNNLVLKLRELRRTGSVSQAKLARLSGVGVKTISSFETGARIDSLKLKQLERILAVYDMTLAEFFAWELSPGPSELPPDTRPWMERTYA